MPPIFLVLIVAALAAAPRATPASTVHVPVTEVPVPPKQYPAQRTLVAAVSASAARASAAAEPAFLALLDEPGFRASLRACCREIADDPARSLLQRLQRELRSAELTHGFNANASHPWHGSGWEGDVDIVGAAQLSYFPNLWINFLEKITPGWRVPEADTSLAEIGMMGFAPFTGADAAGNPEPKSFEEAALRPFYTTANLLHLPTGDPWFGDVTVVLRNSEAQPMALLEPSDTGQFQDFCNSSRPQAGTCGYPIPMNCSGVPGMTYGAWPQGTFEHHVHTLLGNVRLWESGAGAAVPNCTQGVLPRIFGALFGNSSSRDKLNYAELLTFVEVNIAGTVQYPQGVKLIVAEFASLFGTQAGKRVQAWAMQHGWMLAWAFGNSGEQAPQLYGKHLDQATWSADGGRVLDPVVLAHSTANLSATPSAATTFEALWAANSSSTNLRESWAALPAMLRISAGLRADDCADSNACIGVTTGSGRCVCYVRA